MIFKKNEILDPTYQDQLTTKTNPIKGIRHPYKWGFYYKIY